MSKLLCVCVCMCACKCQREREEMQGVDQESTGSTRMHVITTHKEHGQWNENKQGKELINEQQLLGIKSSPHVHL